MQTIFFLSILSVKTKCFVQSLSAFLLLKSVNCGWGDYLLDGTTYVGTIDGGVTDEMTGRRLCTGVG